MATHKNMGVLLGELAAKISHTDFKPDGFNDVGEALELITANIDNLGGSGAGAGNGGADGLSLVETFSDVGTGYNIGDTRLTLLASDLDLDVDIMPMYLHIDNIIDYINQHRDIDTEVLIETSTGAGQVCIQI